MNNFTQLQIIPGRIKSIYLSLLDPLIMLSTRWKVHPNTFTTLSFLLGCVAATFAALESLRLAGSLLLISGICDNIDGRLARHTGQVTKFGALYDSTLDRYQEVFFFFGLAFYFIKSHFYLTAIAVAVAMGGSMMVSYVRARAEGLGFECNVGMMQRAERLVLLGVGCLLHRTVLITVIWIIALLSNLTAVQRIFHVWKIDQEKDVSSNQYRKETSQ